MGREEQIEEIAKERDEELKACNEKQAELENEIEILKIQNKNLEIAFDRLQAENERLTERLKQVLLSIDTVKEMNAMCNIYEQRKQAVKEFASKLKDKAVDFLYSATVDGHPGFDIHISELCHMIDELLKECLND